MAKDLILSRSIELLYKGTGNNDEMPLYRNVILSGCGQASNDLLESNGQFQTPCG